MRDQLKARGKGKEHFIEGTIKVERTKTTEEIFFLFFLIGLGKQQPKEKRKTNPPGHGKLNSTEFDKLHFLMVGRVKIKEGERPPIERG
jgi:hypothetical protein